MHQHPRPAPKRASPANSAQTNPMRTNNQREGMASRTPSRQSISSESDRSGPGTMSEMTRPEDTAAGRVQETARLNLIVQRFFTKAALIILSSRVSLPQAYTKDGDVRMDKWFNTWVHDTSVLGPDLEEWRTLEAGQALPPPLVIDIFLDTAQAAQNQALVIVDDDERRWAVEDALKRQATSPTPSEVIYERWNISLDNSAPSSASSSTPDTPPNVYKKGVVTLRSLFAYARMLPAWKLARRTARQASNGPSPKPGYRILHNDGPALGQDTLTWALHPGSGPVTEYYHFAPLPCVFGLLKISVEYRSNCNFEFDSAERLLSERFAPSPSGVGSSTRTADSGSEEMPTETRYKPWTRMPSTRDDRLEDGIIQTSQDSRPVSASREGAKLEPMPPSVPRRTSVTFQPFKAGSLSSSPMSGLQVSGSPSSSLGRHASTSLASHSRSRSSLNTLPQQALRNPGLPGETAVGSSASSSPKPAPIQRYSSSFGNRRSRFPSSAGSKTEDDNNSSSKGSVSSQHRGSTVSAEGSGEAPAQDDSEAIGDFLKMLDTSSKGLTSLNKTDQASLAAKSQRTAHQYSKFTRMRDSTAQLSESISSSLMLQRSSSSSSRQLSNVPGLVGGASVSSSSSPIKPISPHTPHMPAVPSRLSNNSIAEYSRNESHGRIRRERLRDNRETDRASEATIHDHGTTAIDIPASPRTFPTSRRSSSVHHQGRPIGHIDDDVLPFGLRSASMPNEERPSYAVEDDEPLLFAMGELGSQRRLE